jgi:hypothetical protein
VLCGLTDNSNGATLPWSKCHEGKVNTPQERSIVVLEVMVTVMEPLHLNLATDFSFNGSADERHGHDTDETAVDLLPTLHVGTWVYLDKREARGFLESVGNRNRFGSHATSIEAVEFLVTASVINLGDGRR